jgi:hypothetical protein
MGKLKPNIRLRGFENRVKRRTLDLKEEQKTGENCITRSFRL